MFESQIKINKHRIYYQAYRRAIKIATEKTLWDNTHGVFLNRKGESMQEKEAIRVSKVSIIINLILSVFKLIAGVTACSFAMVTDAVHSASDVFSSIIVIIGVKIANKKSDKSHPYGHERFEGIASIILSTILIITGAGIGISGIQNISSRRLPRL